MDEISASEGKPAEVPSNDKSWRQTPSALKKGHSSQDMFQDDMDSDTNSEGGQGEEVTGMRGGGGQVQHDNQHGTSGRNFGSLFVFVELMGHP